MGQATARALKDSPWRVVIMASSSWSHAFLTEKNHWIYPDLESDRALLEHLKAGNYNAWRDTPLAQMEAAGQQEVLNWTCLAGAMAELDYKADIIDCRLDVQLTNGRFQGSLESAGQGRYARGWQHERIGRGERHGVGRKARVPASSPRRRAAKRRMPRAIRSIRG
jgi:hypothetical protein